MSQSTANTMSRKQKWYLLEASRSSPRSRQTAPLPRILLYHRNTLQTLRLTITYQSTPITEEHPHRAGMDEKQVLEVLDGLLANDGLDGEVVGAIHHNFEQINAARKQRQADYAIKLKRLWCFDS